MKNTAGNSKCTITLEPLGQRVEAEPNRTILQAAQAAGVDLMAVCGGMGTCGSCKVFTIQGDFSPVSLTEMEILSKAELSSGLRLACETRFFSSCTVSFPPESLATLQRLQLEGKQTDVPIDPVVERVEVDLGDITSLDPEGMINRAFEVIREYKADIPGFPEQLRSVIVQTLTANQGKASFVFRDGFLISVIAPDCPLAGFAVDLGTTKIAGYLVDLETGRTLCSAGATNPQIAYGEDVISRIKYANDNDRGAEVLQAAVVQAINGLLDELRQQCGVSRDQVVDSVIVGNTAMHHLLLGLAVRPLGTAPYLTSATQPVTVPTSDIGIKIAEGACIYLPPIIASFVGGDHIAMLLSTDARNRGKTVLAVDIGTNTELSLIHQDDHFSCSCASGPAFEGAHIREGMRAIPGAIEKVVFDGGAPKVKTIQNKPAVGICGSGVLDSIAALRDEKIIDGRGAFNKNDRRVRVREGKPEYVLVDAHHSGHGRDITLDRNDVNQIQLAKAAIRSGVEVLLSRAQIEPRKIDLILLAGAFGTYLDVRSALDIGMFPRLPAGLFQQVGNAAGSGAREMLLSKARRKTAEQMVGRIQYVELMNDPGYTDIFMDAIGFD